MYLPVYLSLMSMLYVRRRMDHRFHSVRLFQEVDLRGFGAAVILKEEFVQYVLESGGS